MRILLFSFVLSICFSSCVEPINKSYTKVPPGIWRGVLVVGDNPVITPEGEEVANRTDFSGELPFNFEVVYTDEETFHLVIHNGAERIKVTDITYGRDRATAKDTLLIDFPDFDTHIKAIYEDNLMEGDWYVNYKENYSIPFKAYFGNDHRFTVMKEKPSLDISGKWAVKFEAGNENEYPAIGSFVQKGNNVTGTFKTETGDYRFLEGTIQGDKVSISTFDAAHAFLFHAKILEDNSLIGTFQSGKHYSSTWTAIKDDNAQLGDAFELTTSQIADKPFDFTFKNLNGQDVSLSDSRFENKMKLVKITGTWCPNCKDESLYLKDYLKNNPSDDIEVIEVAFERYKNEDKAMEILKRYKKKLDLPFTMLYGGYADKSITSEKFPQISKVLSYPTLIFVDKNNKIKNIHTGFAGPATDEYGDFDKKFKNLIASMR